jgi:hypothetical protein
VRSSGSGADANGTVILTVSFGGMTEEAEASETDIVLASARAYLECVNRFLAR